MTQSQVHPFPLDLPRVNGNQWDGLLEVFQAFHRWANSYSPASLLKQEFFHRPPRGLCSLHRDYPPHKHLLLQRALPACLPGWRQTVAVGFRGQEAGEVPLQHILVPSGPETWEAVLDEAHLGFEGPEGQRLLVRVNLETQPSGETLACFTLIAPTEEALFLQELLGRVEAWMEANPHLRGAKLDARGDLLVLDRPYTWEDIILEPGTRAEIDRQIVHFFARLPRYRDFGLPLKRGVLLVGPPGTGKTLLGKVLCSVLSPTFLWVSPGAIGNPEQLQRVFTLARELQPTILFLEDLDLYAGHRGGGGDAFLGELLNQLDGFPDNTGVLTLATTNDPRAIEPALAERPSPN